MKRCSNCGSKDNVVEHHLSYDPEITVPLCQSCHLKVHYSKEPAKVYQKVSRKSTSSAGKGVYLGDHLVGSITPDGDHVYCDLCLFGRDLDPDNFPENITYPRPPEGRFPPNDEFKRHLVEDHTVDELTMLDRKEVDKWPDIERQESN